MDDIPPAVESGVSVKGSAVLRIVPATKGLRNCLLSSFHFPKKKNGPERVRDHLTKEEQSQLEPGPGQFKATRGQPSAEGGIGVGRDPSRHGTQSSHCPLTVSSPGYGHMAPLSPGGKAFCMVYAALGLPASLALVATLRHCLLPALSRPGAWVGPLAAVAGQGCAAAGSCTGPAGGQQLCAAASTGAVGPSG